MKKIFLYLSIFTLALSCESLERENLENPNLLSEDTADPNLLLNSIQRNFASFHYNASSDLRGTVRQINQFGGYAAAADPQGTQGTWSAAYSSVYNPIKKLETLHADKPRHIGIAKVLKAFVFVTLVDQYGDVPYSETLLGFENLNPKADSGASIYDAMLVELDKAIALFDANPSVVAPVANDFYYSGDYTKWKKLATSLKLKIYNNLRLTRDVSTQVNAILGNPSSYMSSNADDFNFRYSNIASPTDSRHPDYINNYLGNPAFYLSNSFYRLMFQDKTVVDPRTRYYFYKQVGTAPTGANLPCSGNASYPICYVGASGNLSGPTLTWGNGYWGRDHGSSQGLPADGTSRTVIGLYPFGGRFDANNHQAANTAVVRNNAEGAGLLNILDYSFVQFMIAELALTEPGVTGTPLTNLLAGVNANLTKVTSFRTDKQVSNTTGLPATTLIPTAAQLSAYATAVSTKYTAATTNDERLNIIIKEFYIASWGNGVEPYNMYRRTGKPAGGSNFIGNQPLVLVVEPFVRSFFYPNNAINNNNQLRQKQITVPVFWDNNPASLTN
jgi:hypothetical protein